MQLARQVYLFLHMPFFSLEENIQYVGNGKKYVRDTIALCRQKEWGKLRTITGAFQGTLADSLCRFYQEKISIDPQAEKIDFSWSSHENPSQRCYTLDMELLIPVSCGIYPAGSYLPSADRLAIEKDVPVSTVRRALTLLNSIGAVKSSRPLGTRVIPFMQSKENCDFTQPAIRGRLLALAESSQIFALSCKEVSHLTLESLDASFMDQWKRKLYWVKEWRHYDMLNYAILDLITQSAPYRAIQTIYSQLLL